MIKLLKSFGYAIRGIGLAIRSERNMRIHLLAVAVVCAAGIYYHLSPPEWAVIVLCSGMVITMEMINTAIEKAIDLVSPEQNKKAGIIKDISAGAVLVGAIVSVAVAMLIFIPKMLTDQAP